MLFITTTKKNMLIVVGKKLRLPLLLLLLFTTRITATLKVSAKGFNYKSVEDKIANGCAKDPFPFNSKGFGYVGQYVAAFASCTHTVSFEKAAIYSYSHIDSQTFKIHQCFPISGTNTTKFGIAVYSVVSNPFRDRICAEGETEEGNSCVDKSKNEIGKYVRIVWLKIDERMYSWCVIDFGFNDSVFDSLEELLDVKVTLQYLKEEKNTNLNFTDPSESICGGFSFSTLKILDDNDPLAQAGAVDQLCYIENLKFVT
ncbi:hypothetical protein RI054_04g23970 [Pseudoscourfieldia marina]